MKNIYKNSLIVIVFIFAFIFKGYLYKFIGNLENFLAPDVIYEVETSILTSENKNLKEEIFRLKENIELEQYANYNYKITRLLITSYEDILNKGIVLLGKSDGIVKNMIVVNNQGLIGIIDEVYKDYSVVNFITGSKNISVKINDNLGIIGSYNNKNKTFLINKIDNYANVNINDEVYTSSYSIYPEDVYLGKVIKISNENYDLEKYVEVKSNIDLYNTYYVGIILGIK